ATAGGGDPTTGGTGGGTANPATGQAGDPATGPTGDPATGQSGDPKPPTGGIAVAGTLEEVGLDVQTYGGKWGWFGLSQDTIDSFKGDNKVIKTDNTFTLTPAPELKTCDDLGTK